MRLEQLQSEYADDLVIVWRSYLLQPQPRPKPRDRFIAYTQGWLRPGGPGDQAPECGFAPWTIDDDEPPTHSLPAAIAGKVAATFGTEAFDRFHLAAMRAYFVEHRTISDPEVLTAIAVETGLPGDEVAARLARDGGALAAVVLEEHRHGIEDVEVHAVPSVVVNRFPIPGAQELDVYRRMIERLLAKRGAS